MGNITSAVPRTQIDPALSALAGKPVLVAGVPAVAAIRALTWRTSSSPPRACTTPTTSARCATFVVGEPEHPAASLVRRGPWSDQWSSTLNATFTTGASQQMQGLPSLSLTVPGGGPVALLPGRETLPLFGGQRPLDGIVGDAFEVVPKMIEAVKKLKGIA